MLDICDSDPERKGRDMGMSLGRERPLQWSGWMFTGGCTGRVRGVSSLVYPFGFGIVLCAFVFMVVLTHPFLLMEMCISIFSS